MSWLSTIINSGKKIKKTHSDFEAEAAEKSKSSKNINESNPTNVEHI